MPCSTLWSSQNTSLDSVSSVRTTRSPFSKPVSSLSLHATSNLNTTVSLPLTSGSLEVVLVRMSRFFNTENNTVFFDGKFAGTEVFKSLACGDLITAVFDFAHSVCALRLTDQQVALFSALVLINADRPCLEDRGRVQRVQRSVVLGLTHILHKDNRDSLMHKLYQRMSVLRSLCSLHMEKLRWFSQRYPLTANSLFPPLYKELFASEAELMLLPGITH
uniref:NR LBD domain-containing protein n=1 Tax=Hippocampus comes TaxID=109280 RepID=A0A3Q3D8A9_HIPCM